MDYQSERFKAFIPFILQEECSYPSVKTGQYSNLPNDPGGPTKWGIDLRGQRAYAKAFGENPLVWTQARIKALTYDQALGIYALFYWNGPPNNPHLCETLPPKLGEVTMNSWVNGGKPTKWLAECDNDAGRYLDLQEAYYRSLTHLSEFLPDWLARTGRLRAYLGLQKSDTSRT